MPAKFKIGDTVIISDRCPDFIKDICRYNRKRTIVAVFYEVEKQCNYYLVGSNGLSVSDTISCFYFRSYHLQPALERCVGRPKSKRRRGKGLNTLIPIEDTGYAY